ncbi:MAG: MerR family transcriptional regulator [Actinomycetaceae bacterium]|nr:MerR family transcriptional regulator [Actinomycetaceae bacterium]
MNKSAEPSRPAQHEGALTVAEMSAVTGVSAHTLRYWEGEGLLRAVARSAGNHRLYSPADVEWVRFLVRLRETGMPIAAMREYAGLRAQGDVTLGPRLRLLEQHRDRLCERIAELKRHEDALERKIAIYHESLRQKGKS